MKFIKNLKIKEEGLTLIEMLTSIAIFGIFSLGIASTFLNATQMTIRSQEKIFNSSVVETIVEMLNDSFENQTQLNSFPTFGNILAPLIDSNGNTVYTELNTYKVAVKNYAGPGTYHTNIYFRVNSQPVIPITYLNQIQADCKKYNEENYTPNVFSYKTYNFKVSVYKIIGSGVEKVIENFKMNLYR